MTLELLLGSLLRGGGQWSAGVGVSSALLFSREEGQAGLCLGHAAFRVFDSPPGEGEGLPVYSCLKSTGEAVTSGDRNLGPPHMV